MKGKRLIPRPPLAKLTLYGTAMVMASALTINGFSTTAEDSAKDKRYR